MNESLIQTKTPSLLKPELTRFQRDLLIAQGKEGEDEGVVEMNSLLEEVCKTSRYPLGGTIQRYLEMNGTPCKSPRSPRSDYTDEQLRELLEPLMRNGLNYNIRHQNCTIHFRFDGEYPLLCACHPQRREVVGLILLGCDGGKMEGKLNLETMVHTGAKGWRTPLLMASASGHHNLVEKLLLKGANPFALDPKGSSALILACENRYERVALLLMDYYYYVGKEGVNFLFRRNSEGDSFVDVAQKRGLSQVLQRAEGILSAHKSSMSVDPADPSKIPAPSPLANHVSSNSPSVSDTYPTRVWDRRLFLNQCASLYEASGGPQRCSLLRWAVEHIRARYHWFHGVCHTKMTPSIVETVGWKPYLSKQVVWHTEVDEVEIAFLETAPDAKTVYLDPVQRMRYAYEAGEIALFDALRAKGVPYQDLIWKPEHDNYCYPMYFERSNEGMMNHLIDLMEADGDYRFLFRTQTFGIQFIEEARIRGYDTPVIVSVRPFRGSWWGRRRFRVRPSIPRSPLGRGSPKPC